MSFDKALSLSAEAREEKGKSASRRLRRADRIPVTVYGGSNDAASGTVARREIAALLRRHGRNAIFTLDLAGAATPVKIADLQIDPIKGRLLHVDFMRISLTEKTEFEVPLEVVGEAPGVKNQGGILDQPLHTVKIRCLPTELPAKIEVDVSSLNLGDHIRVADLAVDRDKIELITDAEVVIATIAAPRVEEEAAPPAEEQSEPEVIKRGKADEEGE